MSIKILSEQEIQQQKNEPHAPPLLFANPQNLYQRRSERLKKLAKDHPLQDYLLFLSTLVDAQLSVLKDFPLPKTENLTFNAYYPLHIKQWQRDPIWQDILQALLAKLKPQANEMMLTTIENLEKSSHTEIEHLADQLLAQELSLVSSDKALFIWSALSVYWLQLVQQLPRQIEMESNKNLQHCPICASSPTASVVHLGSQQGLRYLHCSLCETEWNVVRSQCTNCEQSEKLDYWSIDNEFAAVKTESCGDCHSYLKIFYQEKDPYLEPIADDLASIFLDIEMEDKGFLRSGFNPLLFSDEN
ncbi:formate dehydrogenase accessory protein FdhE [Haemophilus haemoglobinophilus]|nr:formate dehydrogenase accessory protein FdhE [Canicola haemoglobinophilus]MBN6712198.1 formate dehydrogenase accessory protein FdhE [Canicola haemoglobinophilus]